MKNTKKILGAISALTCVLFTGSVMANTGDVVVNSGTTINTGAVLTGATLTGTTSNGIVASTTTTVKKVEGLDFIDSSILSVRLSSNVTNISTGSEIKIIQDFAITNVEKNIDDGKKIHVKLVNDLQEGVSYNIIPTSGDDDLSIDFTMSGAKLEILNKDNLKVKSVDLTNTKEFDIVFADVVTATSLDLKMFKELKTKDLVVTGSNITVQMIEPLLSKVDHIMILTLKDLENKDIEIQNFIYDFTTPEFTIPVVVTNTGVTSTGVVNTPTSTGTELVDANIPTSTGSELTATTLTGETLSGATASGTDLTTVAMNAKTTPETGTKTNVMILIALVLSMGVIASRKKALKS